jgi:deoxyribodipyrimidine photo-lyase
MNGLFVFHRDFRIIDNISLNKLNEICDNIYVVFIFTPEQVTNKNHYKSDNSIQFMIESLKELESDIKSKGGKLIIQYGNSKSVLKKLIEKLDINIVATNRDYTPFAKEREKEYIDVCKSKNIEYVSLNDYYLYEPGSIIVKSTGKAYTKYTPFYEKVSKIGYNKPSKYKKINFSKSKYSGEYSLHLAEKELIKVNSEILVKGGRRAALKILSKINVFKNYSKERNSLTYSTTELSAYIKFGCVSVREVAEKFRQNNALFRQLIWREFYMQILNDYPYVLKGPLKEQYKGISWSKSIKNLDAWKNGETGFPIVDAAMRQMNTTGYMHNRGRLIVASFLIKTLLINWQEGEKYFATMLTDYDPASNNGNWQWVASTGADSQPYFRIFNPWSQSEEHDPDCEYIKEWIPELKNVENSHIHKWYEYYQEYLKDNKIRYFKPIVDYKLQREKAIEMYKKALD